MNTAKVYASNSRGVEIRSGSGLKRFLDISWGAIIGGWLVAATIAMVMYALGAASGITAVRLTDLSPIDSKMLFSSAVWLIVTWIVSLSIGAYFAAAVSRTHDERVGGWQGIGVWALSNIMTILVLVTGLGAAGLATVGIAGVSGSIIGSSFVANDLREQEKYRNPASFQARLKEVVSPRVTAQLQPETVALVSSEFIIGDRESARNALLLNTTLTRAEADAVVNDLSQQTAEAKVRLKLIADRTAYYTSIGLLLSALISVLSLIGAFVCGKAGICDFLRTEYDYLDEDAETVVKV